MIEPSAQIIAFVERQAEPVRGNIYFHIAAGAAPDVMQRPDEVKQLAMALLDVPPSTLAIYRAAMAIGALDFGFAFPSQAAEQYAAELPEQVREHPKIKPTLLQAPLNRRYLDAAAAEWAQLRQSSLSQAALVEYLTKHSTEWVLQELGG